MALDHPCRLQRSEEQTQAGLDIVVALDRQGFKPRDHFIVHTLEKYGYPVFRIPYDMSTESRQFQRVIQDIQETLNRAD